jgi:putative transposase
MPRIAPSTRIREEIAQLLGGSVPKDQDVVGTLLRLGAQRLAQELLEEEATDFLGRDRYVRHRGTEPHRGYRNGYEPGRVRTAEGEIPLQIPQVRQTPVPYQSRLLSFLRGHTDVLDRLVAEMYARGAEPGNATSAAQADASASYRRFPFGALASLRLGRICQRAVSRW